MPESNRAPNERTALSEPPNITCFSPASFWAPRHLVPSAWHEHAPFAFWLVEALRPRTFVELGSHYGFSYLAFCQAVQHLCLPTRCFAVDTWLGDEHAGFYNEEVFSALSTINDANYSTFSRLIRARFNEALPYFPDGEIDLLHIDGRHGREDVLQDFEDWRPKLSDRAVVLFHDTNVRERGFGVWSIWRDLSERHPSFEFFHAHGLGVLGFGPNLPEAVRPLFASAPEQAAAIRAGYSRLGSAVTGQATLERLRDEAHQHAASIEQLQHEIAALNTRPTDADVAALRRDLGEKDVELAALGKGLSEKDVELAALGRDLGEKDVELTALRKGLSEKDIQIAALREMSEAVQSALDTALEERHLLAEVQQAHTAAFAALRQEADILLHRARNAEAAHAESSHRLGLVENSTTWRASSTLRRGAARLPSGLRSNIRRSAKALWWAVTPHRMPERLRFLRDRQAAELRLSAEEAPHEAPGAPEIEAEVAALPPPAPDVPVTEPATVKTLRRRYFPALEAFPSFTTPSDRPRVSVVTDSLGPSSLFGGVASALLLGALLANRLDGVLRIITRHDPADAEPVRTVLESNGVVLDGPLELAFVPFAGSRDIPVSDKDVFLTTSWWSTRATMDSVPRHRIAMIVQEDERLFYPNGDERLLCAETLSQPDIPAVVNSRLLYDHLVKGADPLPNIRENGIWFEPAFPGAAPEHSGNKRRFFFYARPNNNRNLFLRGVEALEAAASEGLFAPDQWEMFWVGKDIPEVELANGVKPIRTGGLKWDAYQSLVSSMDAGLVLMDTPHPSYPPLDLAAAGAVVLTNTHPGKDSLDHYSANILMAPSTLDGLLEGLRRLEAMALDDKTRADNRAADRILRDWTVALEPVVSHLAVRFAES